MHCQLHIYRLQYSIERNCAATRDNRLRCPLYCKFGAKYSAHHPVYPMWTVIPDIYNALPAPYIQASIFDWTYHRCYSRCIENSTRVIPQAWCQIRRTSPRLCYLNCGPRHIQRSCNSAYSGLNIQLNVSALPLEISRQLNVRYTANLVPNTAHILQFTLCELWSRPYTMCLHFFIFKLQYST
jgi:hypothetical protein